MKQKEINFIEHVRRLSNSYQHTLNVMAYSKQQVSFAGHRSLVIVLPVQKVSQPLVKADLRPN